MSYVIEAPARGWRWTYTGISEAEAREVADSLAAHSGERWEVRPEPCRTCGFTDCPGASGEDCPRWPADDPPEYEPPDECEDYEPAWWVTDEIWAEAAAEYARELADR
jgi:hypothetical protein